MNEHEVRKANTNARRMRRAQRHGGKRNAYRMLRAERQMQRAVFAAYAEAEANTDA